MAGCCSWRGQAARRQAPLGSAHPAPESRGSHDRTGAPARFPQTKAWLRPRRPGEGCSEVDSYPNPDKGFSGSGLETIAGLKVELGLKRVDLVGGNGRDDVNEGVDDGSMLGQIERRELLDMADVGHVPGIEQGFIV